LSPKHFYEFGPFRLDVGLNRLEREGQVLPLPPKAFDLLVLLARNTDRVLPKSELIETLWPNTFVEEANLTQHVYTLRKALGDQPNGEPYIDTVPRRGYRLAAIVRQGSRDVPARDPTAAVSPVSTAAPASVQDQRKPAAVLRCAIADAADVVERIGSGAMQDLTRRLIEVSEAELNQYEGVISQRHSDGFVALCGAHAVHEDDGRRAILAALAIQRHAKDMGIDLRMGIDVGPLVISRTATAAQVTYSAVGEAVREADLLHQFAPPGAILISEATWRAVERHIAADEVSPAPPGQRAYRVTGVLRKPTGVCSPRRALIPFIGRQQEITVLQRLAEQAITSRGQVVSIVGEPGMGKSRLVYEVTRSLSRSDIVTLEGRCVSYGSLVPYLPLIDLLRAHCAIDEIDPPEIIRQSIDAAVRDHGLPLDASSWLLRLIGIVDSTTASDTVRPEAIKARTFDVLRTLFLKAAVRHPLIIVVEDLHWIDRTSEEFLATLVERLVGARVMLLATHRPGYRAPWLDRSYVTQITLSPLTPADSAQLVEAITPERARDGAVARAILDRGEGNPFFLEELARTVVEQSAGEQMIPKTVQGVIMARLDRLPDAAKQLLQAASVLGREVPRRQLERVSRGDALDEALAELCRQEFMYERAVGDEPIFVFKHALTQDVAYDSLLSRRRSELHLEAARALEELYADRLDEMTATLAYHYARTSFVDESVTWLVRAAERAARVYANAEAILHLELAARRLQRLPEGKDRDRRTIDVALRQAHSLYFLGKFRESVDVLLPHEARLARLADPALTGAYSFWLAHMYSRLGDQRRASESAHRAIDNATRAGDQATLGKAHGLLALEGHWSGDTVDGIAHGTRAIQLLGTLPEQRWWLGMAHFYLAMNYLLTHDSVAALAEAARANAVGKEIGDPRLQTYAGFTTGWIEIERGRSSAAVAVVQGSLEQAPDRVSRAYASMILAYALLETGKHEEAAARLQGTIAELESFAFPQWHSLASILLAEAQRLSGQFDEAARWNASGIELASRANYRYAIDLGRRVRERIERDRAAAP
jgi:DNA-binding winged helix-turn-helix (wHTH) protein/tetratricopeptide (TPR) repeat protein